MTRMPPDPAAPPRVLKPFPYTPPPQLLGDIGGTNARFALADNGVLRPGSIRRIATAEQPDLTELVSGYLKQVAAPECDAVCLAVAGPVRDGRVEMTNLPRGLTPGALAGPAGTERVFFLNDLQAQGHALPGLAPRQLRALRPGAAPADGATRLVVGIGTGLNAAVVLATPGGLLVPPSEAGHIHLPQQDDEERALARWLAARHGIATAEEALSGRGLSAIHAFRDQPPATPAALVAAIASGDSQARATGALYARLLGRFLAGLALIHLPWGGIFLSGGAARALAPHLMDLGLEQGFTGMGRYSDLLRDIAIWLIDDDYAALTGCAAFLAAQRG